jgi:CBS domain-containing protein
MAGDNTNIVKRSLEDLKAAATARDLGRVVRGLLGRWSPDARLGDVVRSIMSRNVATCSTSDTLHRAAQLMWERDCGSIPVVGAEGRLVGIVTDRDLCMAAYTQSRPLTDISVASVLSARVHSCLPSDSLDHAVGVMRAERVRRLVVVDGSQKVVGMLSLADLARYVADLPPTRRDASVLLSDLLSSLSERRPSNGSAERAAE